MRAIDVFEIANFIEEKEKALLEEMDNAEQYRKEELCAVHDFLVDFVNGLAQMSIVEAEPVVESSWKFYKKQNKATCMNCSFERDLDADFGGAVFCPRCGAKMGAE